MAQSICLVAMESNLGAPDLLCAEFEWNKYKGMAYTNDTALVQHHQIRQASIRFACGRSICLHPRGVIRCRNVSISNNNRLKLNQTASSHHHVEATYLAT